MIIFGGNCSEFVLIWIIVLLIKILNTFWICINAGGWNYNYPEYPRPQYFTKYQMHHIVQDDLVYIYQCIHWLWNCKLVWSFEALLEGKSSLRGSLCFTREPSFPNVFKSNISKGLMRNLYQNGSYCIFNRQIIFVVDRNRNTFLLISINVNFLVVHVAFSWRKPTV